MGIKRFGLKPIHTQIGINIFMKPMKRLRLEMVRGRESSIFLAAFLIIDIHVSKPNCRNQITSSQ